MSGLCKFESAVLTGFMILVGPVLGVELPAQPQKKTATIQRALMRACASVLADNRQSSGTLNSGPSKTPILYIRKNSWRMAPVQTFNSDISRVLKMEFPHLPIWVRSQIADSAELGVRDYIEELQRVNVGPPHAQNATHTFDEGVLEGIVAGWDLQSPTERGAMVQLALFLNKIDDLADAREKAIELAAYIVGNPGIGFDELMRIVHPDAPKFWDNEIQYLKSRLPHFNEEQLQFATLLMIYGSPMFNEDVEARTRQKIKLRFKEIILKRLKNFSSQQRDVYQFVAKLDLEYIGYVSKVLPWAVYGSKGIKNEELIVLAGLLSVPGLIFMHHEKEIETGQGTAWVGLRPLYMRQRMGLVYEQVKKRKPSEIQLLMPFYAAYYDVFQHVLENYGLSGLDQNFLLQHWNPRRFHFH